MSPSVDKRALEAARRREEQGQIDVAVALYSKAGAAQEGARLLASRGRHTDAGKVLLESLGVAAGAVGTLDAPQRKLAHVAAIYLAKGGEVGQAVELLVALGEQARAADLLEQSGDYVNAERLRRGAGLASSSGAGHAAVADGAPRGEEAARRAEGEGQLELAVRLYAKAGLYRDAGRLLAQQGKLGEAARAFAAAEAPYEAGVCFLHAGDEAAGLAELLKVAPTEPGYRKAAVQVVRCCRNGATLDFSIEHFLSEFLSCGPQDKVEMEAYYVLAGLYQAQGMADSAADLLRQILAKAPNGYRDVAEKLAKLSEGKQVKPEDRQRIAAEDAAFRGDKKAGSSGASLTSGGRVRLASLPGLPPLRDPAVQAAEAQAGANASGVQAPPASTPPLAGGTMAAVPGTAGLPPLSQPAAVNVPAAGQPGPPVSGSSGPAPAPTGPPAPEAGPAPANTVDGFQPALESLSAKEIFTVGATVAERYKLVGKLGEGGMAVVYRAHDIELDDEIAIKVFLQQTFDRRVQQESLARFKEELKLTRRLSHPNIIRLYDIGMFGGHRYITMELLNGSGLDGLLERGGITYGRGLRLLVQACAGLQAAHDQGVVHRDIKPENLFVAEGDVVKVLDFGIAKNTQVTGQTVAGMIAGTPQYMAPEQIDNFSSVSPATDLYALGVIAFRMFTGKVPFEHEEMMRLLVMHINDEPPAPRTLNPQIPEALEALILRALRKDPTERQGSCRELAAELEQLAEQFPE